MEQRRPLPKPADQQRVADSSTIPEHGNDRSLQPAPGSPNGADEPQDTQGINPRNVGTMPRAEDDDATRNNSPEYRDGRDRLARDDQRGRQPAQK